LLLTAGAASSSWTHLPVTLFSSTSIVERNEDVISKSSGDKTSSEAAMGDDPEVDAFGAGRDDDDDDEVLVLVLVCDCCAVVVEGRGLLPDAASLSVRTDEAEKGDVGTVNGDLA
jgi:hypothetical protein